ncbi:TetR/AcrR family transcriptional regulator [Rhodococcus sp. NPDC057014]|uniref:TetR/AcrR family transcriptional regulator n=1 Tax=unclassified Rhodococcus (in: high G+C Gram-positive bacteria) TaxID=192944 RepID=UPI0023E1D272|nr:TetR/AcrR family transcriptional regulator [Rhodococcus sp. T2V]MDF3310603.1 TetR/AcrR family transcriptional regulator [Rhodococcus sp. T2V]
MKRHGAGRSVAATPVTKDDVREAALSLFAERGYHGTSLKEIAQELGIRTPSLYNHMESKGSLLSEIVLQTLHYVVRDFERVLAENSDPIERLRAATAAYAYRHATHRRQALIVNQEAIHLHDPDHAVAQDIRRRHERGFRQLIVDGQNEGVFTVDSPKVASFAIREMCVSVARWFREDGLLSAADIADRYSRFALGIVGAEGAADFRPIPFMPSSEVMLVPEGEGAMPAKVARAT